MTQAYLAHTPEELLGEIYDQADKTERDFMDEARWHQIELEEERELNIEAALTECMEKGVSFESLKVLAMETGAQRWALKNSMKG